MAFLIQMQNFSVTATEQIIKRHELQKLVSADAILKTARAEKASLLAQARLNARALTDKARLRAVEEGQKAIALELASLAAKQQQLLVTTIPLMSKLIGEALCAIAGDIDQERRIEHAATRLRHQLQGVRWIRFQVAPRRVQLTRRALAKSRVVKNTGLSADVIENASLSDDEFIMETDLGFATGRMSEQIQLLHELCVAALQHAGSELTQAKQGSSKERENVDTIQCEDAL